MKKTAASKRKKTYKTLAIIGNGFDIAHNYATLYKSFIDATKSESLDIFKEYCEKDGSITTWYSFEENIKRLTEEMHNQSFREGCDFDVVSQEQVRLRDVFIDIHNLLIRYLKQETESKPVIKLPLVKKYLKRKTKAISFNYTKIAAAYSCDVFYVHGSLAEDDILLGYDYRDEVCLAQYDDIRWGKIICRKALAFRRYLKNDLQLQPGSAEYDERIAGIEAYLHYENSGRGIDVEVEDFIPHYQFVDQFMQAYRKDGDIPRINYSKVSTIVVLGHGIEADRIFLEQILKKCTRLKKVVIFRYAGESDISYKAKSDFFKPYCKRIRSVMYR